LLYACLIRPLDTDRPEVVEVEADTPAAARDAVVALRGAVRITSIIADPPKGEKEPEPAMLPRIRSLTPGSLYAPRTVRRFARVG
jgi:hypothetical protein